MKRCPECRRDYHDSTLSFCVDDGAVLVEGPARAIGQETAFFGARTADQISAQAPTLVQIHETSQPHRTARTNLGSEPGLLIGREAELGEVGAFLSRPEVRLLTVTGIGGTGKTRLARTVGHESLDRFTDGVFFIDLSAIEDPRLLTPAIARALDVREEGERPLIERMCEYLREKEMLLVLDNFEQITDAAPQVAELLAGTIRPKILATSRIRLHLRFEHEFPLRPLEIPDHPDTDSDALTRFPSVALFVERARAVKPSFDLTENNAAAVAGICRRLDGLPLAIELAAVRIKMLTPQAILTHLSGTLDLLTGGARDLPERQQTMRAAIAWSYDLLDDLEKKLFRRLAVFSGGLTLEAAEAVAGSADLQSRFLDSVGSLVDKSLMLQHESPVAEPRFRMLEVVREFALEELKASGEADQIKRLHADFYAALSDAAEPGLKGSKVAAWLDILEDEHANLRSAIDWGLDNDPEIALRIIGAIRFFWKKRGYLREGVKLVGLALESSGIGTDPRLCAKANWSGGDLFLNLGDYSSAQRLFEEALALARELDDKYLISISLWGMGIVKREEGDLAGSKVLMEESLALARELKDERLISLRLNTLGEIARLNGDYGTAFDFYTEARAMAKQGGFRNLIPVPAGNMAAAACQLGDYDAARVYSVEALKGNEELGDRVQIGTTLNVAGAVAVGSGDAEKGARIWGKAQSLMDETGYRLKGSIGNSSIPISIGHVNRWARKRSRRHSAKGSR